MTDVSEHRPPDPGFTVVELLVAVVLLAVGILGLSATSGAVAWQMNAAHLSTVLEMRAQAEMETLLARRDTTGLASPAPAAGAYDEGDRRVSWQITGGAPRRVVVVVEGRLGSLQLADTLVTLVWSS